VERGTHSPGHLWYLLYELRATILFFCQVYRRKREEKEEKGRKRRGHRGSKRGRRGKIKGGWKGARTLLDLCAIFFTNCGQPASSFARLEGERERGEGRGERGEGEEDKGGWKGARTLLDICAILFTNCGQPSSCGEGELVVRY